MVEVDRGEKEEQDVKVIPCYWDKYTECRLKEPRLTIDEWDAEEYDEV